ARALCFPEGTGVDLASGRVRVEATKTRAFSRFASAEAELELIYLGPTAELAPLGSGELRRQIGLKLRAQDSCNVLYVMWQIEPRAHLVASVKQNPGQHIHSQCLTNGYRNISPDRATTSLPVLRPGTSHTLRAELDGPSLRVQIDGAEGWTFNVGKEIGAIHGSAGLRTDNAAIVFQLSAPLGAVGLGASHGCPATPDE